MIVMSKIQSTRQNIPAAIDTYLKEILGVNYTGGVVEDFVDINGQAVLVIGIDPGKMEFLLGLSTKEGMK
jgi:hypothetical protein